DDRPINS
ncbi:hypothetical protein MKD33_02370, partial [Chromobacterium piscinae]